MKSESNRDLTKVYTLLSTYENTFVLFYDNQQDNLWISPPLPRDRLLMAMYFVLTVQLYQHGSYTSMPDELSTIVQGLLDNSPVKHVDPDSLNSSSSSASTLDTSQNSVKENDLNKFSEHSRKQTKESLADSLCTIWKKGPREMIGSGRTSFVVKCSLNKKNLALKMVNLFKHAKYSLEELENEKDVMLWINTNTGIIYI
jgi:hypothetical protein